MQDQYPHVTILIPIRNVAKFIRGCLDAILDQTYPREMIEVWLLDHNSDDGSIEIINEYKDKGIKIIQCGVHPPAQKYNMVLPLVKSEIIGLVDGDAYVGRDWLEKVVKPLLEDEKTVGASGIIKTANEEKLIARLVGYDWQHRSERSTKNLKRVQSMHTVYKKKVLEEVGGFNEKLKTGYDAELGYKINRLGYQIRHVGDAVTRHCHRDNLLAFWKQQFEYGKFAIIRYFSIPENIKGDSFAPWWLIIQPLFYPASFLLLLLSLMFSWGWWLFFLVPLCILYSFYILQAVWVANRYKKWDALLIVIIYFIRPLAWGFGALAGLILLMKKFFRKV